MHTYLELDLRSIQQELRNKIFVRSNSILAPADDIFRGKEHGYRRIDDSIFLHVMNFEANRPYSLMMARKDLVCMQITIRGAYKRAAGEHIELVNRTLMQITNYPSSISHTEAGTKFRGIMIACERQYILDHFGLNVAHVPQAYKPIFLSKAGMAEAFGLPVPPSILTTADQIISCSYSEPLKSVYLRAKTNEIICDIVAQINGLSGHKPPRIRADQSKAQAIEAAAAIYRREIGNPPTIKQMERRVGLNRNELTLGFRDLFGATPHAYGQMVRMKEAKDLLSDGHLSISEIARLVGYEGYSSFSRAYQAHYGRAPSLGPISEGDQQ